jgi:hypothetical protein
MGGRNEIVQMDCGRVFRRGTAGRVTGFGAAGGREYHRLLRREGWEDTKISRNGDNVYQYLNHQKAGDWIGVAIREGDSLSIGWQKSDGRNLGVSVYRIEKGDKGDKGPTLTGVWSPYPGGGMVKDSLKWSRKVD